MVDVSRWSVITKRLDRTRRCLFRVKHMRPAVSSRKELSRCLTTFDLTNLGIGSILGAGIYVVTGQVAMNIAGPSIIISFTIAAFASLLSGLCYAEFGSRVPHTTGSAYAYSYRTVGEFIAFVIGWNLILEYMIGTAADARALSGAIDALTGQRMANLSLSTFGHVPGLDTGADPLALILTLVVTAVLAAGVKESARFTGIFNVLNAAIALLVIGIGATKANTGYWYGHPGFFPHGAHGVFAGAAACFYAFVGFDIIATTGEEARTADKSIPWAVALSLFCCFFLYIGVSAVLTLMVPFGSLHSAASPITAAFDMVGLPWAKWVIGAGAVFGLTASLIGSEFPLPRIIYAMAVDGLLFRWFRCVSERTETPVLATVVPGVLTALFALLFDLQELVEMMSIGTLLAYSLVCTSVLILRYRPPTDLDWTREERDNNAHASLEDSFAMAAMNNNHKTARGSHLNDESDDEVYLDADEELASSRPLLHHSQATDRRQLPTSHTERLVIGLTLVVWILSAALSTLLVFTETEMELGRPAPIVFAVLLLLGIIVCIGIVWKQPQDWVTLQELHFTVPLVPLLPMATIFINVFLMVRLSRVTWIRFAVWMGIGLLIYFIYGIRNSEESKKDATDQISDSEMPSPQPCSEASSDHDEAPLLISSPTRPRETSTSQTPATQDDLIGKVDAEIMNNGFYSVPLTDNM